MPQDIRSFFGGRGGQGPTSGQEKPVTKDVVRTIYPSLSVILDQEVGDVLMIFYPVSFASLLLPPKCHILTWVSCAYRPVQQQRQRAEVHIRGSVEAY